MAPSAPTRDRTRTAVVEAAARLLRDAGGDAVTTRAVAEAAGVQAPTLYRLFGDKDGLLEAVVEHELATFVAAKAAQVRAAAEAEDDPVEDLRAGWHRQVEFGLTHPAVFALLSDPARAARSAAARSGREVLAARVHRVALAGRLRVGSGTPPSWCTPPAPAPSSPCWPCLPATVTRRCPPRCWTPSSPRCWWTPRRPRTAGCGRLRSPCGPAWTT
ncbi:TetR/AcrR family transcriptional regulator [Klenkia terrae]|uniref:TetR/AcrR family transcriptional regulator n=1 Tax=Klenkia terrae TaxID=1052259 RepID=UPI0036068670